MSIAITRSRPWTKRAPHLAVRQQQPASFASRSLRCLARSRSARNGRRLRCHVVGGRPAHASSASASPAPPPSTSSACCSNSSPRRFLVGLLLGTLGGVRPAHAMFFRMTTTSRRSDVAIRVPTWRWRPGRVDPARRVTRIDRRARCAARASGLPSRAARRPAGRARLSHVHRSRARARERYGAGLSPGLVPGSDFSSRSAGHSAESTVMERKPSPQALCDEHDRCRRAAFPARFPGPGWQLDAGFQGRSREKLNFVEAGNIGGGQHGRSHPIREGFGAGGSRKGSCGRRFPAQGDSRRKWPFWRAAPRPGAVRALRQNFQAMAAARVDLLSAFGPPCKGAEDGPCRLMKELAAQRSSICQP